MQQSTLPQETEKCSFANCNKLFAILQADFNLNIAFGLLNPDILALFSAFESTYSIIMPLCILSKLCFLILSRVTSIQTYSTNLIPMKKFWSNSLDFFLILDYNNNINLENRILRRRNTW